MSRLEIIDRNNWEDFLAAPAAVLMLGKTDCHKCQEWTRELESFLEADEDYKSVRFGKLFLDVPGMAHFKKANPWIAELDNLPFNVIYINGEKKKEYAGLGIERLTSRLKRVLEA